MAMKRIISFFLWFVGVLALLFAGFLGYFTVRDYQPETREQIAEHTDSQILLDTISCITWNIGYGGLGKDMSFFYDGGNKVRTTKTQTLRNLGGIQRHIRRLDSVDLFLLQEVDTNSKRSYYINQFNRIRETLDSTRGYFATNYSVDFIPVPWTEPLGKVRAGLATFSDYAPEKVVRHAFPGNFSWPKRLFMLDRCFLVSRYSLLNGAQLLIINTHNSAYDDGSLKRRQMKYLKSFLMDEYQKGNYIIAGGDWNQFPPTINSDTTYLDLSKTSTIQDDYMPDSWTWAADLAIPTNRSLNAPLNPHSRKAVIDFFLVSPNIEVLQVETQDVNFEYSDHQPVFAKFRLVK